LSVIPFGSRVKVWGNAERICTTFRVLRQLAAGLFKAGFHDYNRDAVKGKILPCPGGVTIVYNQPGGGGYTALGEGLAESGVLEAVAAVAAALREMGYQTERLALNPPLKAATSVVSSLRTGLFFNLFEGFEGLPDSEAAIARAIEKTGISFTGCPPEAIALAGDKVAAARLLVEAGIAVPGFWDVTGAGDGEIPLELPCIVKPAGEHASHGLSESSVVTDMASLSHKVAELQERYGGAIVEEFIDGRELSVLVMGNRTLRVLPVSEIAYDLPPSLPRLLTFDAKWRPESAYYRGTSPVCPASLSPAELGAVVPIAKRVFRLFGCSGYARVDLRQDREGNFRVIDVNPNPDLSPSAGAARQACAGGLKYPQFIAAIVRLALEGRADES